VKSTNYGVPRKAVVSTLFRQLQCVYVFHLVVRVTFCHSNIYVNSDTEIDATWNEDSVDQCTQHQSTKGKKILKIIFLNIGENLRRKRKSFMYICRILYATSVLLLERIWIMWYYLNYFSSSQPVPLTIADTFYLRSFQWVAFLSFIGSTEM